jgi:hypothetical protein
VQSDVVVRSSTWLGFPCDRNLGLRDVPWPVAFARLVRFAIEASRTYDVFHFNWGMSLVDHRAWGVHLWDVPLVKRLGKRVIVTFQGCDARLKTWSREHLATSACAECDVAWCHGRLDDRRRARITIWTRHADQLFALNPDLLHAVPHAEFLPYAHVDPAAWRSEAPAPPPSGRAWRIAHLPTNRSIKGTRYVEAAIAQLQREGLSIELALIEGVPHRDIHDHLAAADLVVDQLLVGWYGGVAVEAMALGKPVLCFLRDDDLKRFVPFHDLIPVVRTTAQTLGQDLRALMTSPQRWATACEAGPRFVQQCHDPRRIALRTMRAYAGSGRLDRCAV